jgi:hypothetical protein
MPFLKNFENSFYIEFSLNKHDFDDSDEKARKYATFRPIVEVAI